MVPVAAGGTQSINYGMDPDVVNDARYKDKIETALLAIPSLSIVTDLTNMFNTKTGIYMNAMQDGLAWERPISLELIKPDGSDGFQINAGLRIRGGVSRSGGNPKHNFRLFFRSEYGDSQLEYPLFEKEGVKTFKRMDLRTAQNFSWNLSDAQNATWLYDIFSRDTQRDMGQPYTRSRYYHLYINGQYWGLYQTEERPEANYGESYFGGGKGDYDTIKADNDNGKIYAVDGNVTAYQSLWTEVNGGVKENEKYFRLQGIATDGITAVSDYPRLLNVDNLIDYMLVIFYGGNRDCPLGPPGSDSHPRNLYSIYNRVTPNGFLFLTHDNEHTLGVHFSQGVNFNRVSAKLGSSLSQKQYFNPWWLHSKLATDNAEYRLRFADRVYRHFFNGGALTADAAVQRFTARKNEIDMAVIAESARWGDYLTANKPRTKDGDWLVIVNKIINNYLNAKPSTRTDIVFKQIKTAGWYPAVNPPVFSQHGGSVPANYPLSITAEPGIIYFTADGSDPRLPGGAVNPTAAIYAENPILLAQSTHIKARAQVDQTWSALADAAFVVDSSITQDLRITEIQYNPAESTAAEKAAGFSDKDEFEFIELVNCNSSHAIDLANVCFTAGIGFEFKTEEMPRLAPNARILLVKNRAAFTSRYGNNLPVYGEYTGNLSNGGERILLVDAKGNPILDFTYKDSDPWPTAPDGSGPSLQVIDMHGDYNNPLNWKASKTIHGTPGKEDDVTIIEKWMQY